MKTNESLVVIIVVVVANMDLSFIDGVGGIKETYTSSCRVTNDFIESSYL